MLPEEIFSPVENDDGNIKSNMVSFKGTCGRGIGGTKKVVGLGCTKVDAETGNC